MDSERLDLSVIDPLSDAHEERLVRAITRRAGPELMRRAAQNSPIALVASWARPALAAAAVMVVLSSSVLRMTRDARFAQTPDYGIVEALHLPAPVADWIVEDRTPTVRDLILVIEGDAP